MSARTISTVRVPAPGGAVSVTVHEDSVERSVVLVHGSFGQSRLWDPVVSHLPRGYRVFALDMPGHGDSDWRETYGIACIIEAITAVTNAAPGPVLLGGHSMGAAACMAAAAELGGRLAGVAFLDIDPMPPPSQAAHLNEVGKRPPRVFASFDDLVARESRMAPGATPETHRHMAEHCYRQVEGGWMQKFDQQFLAQAETWDMRPHLPAITVPALVLRGAKSTVMSQQGFDDLLAGLPDRRGIHVPGASHQLHLEQPVAVAAELAAFASEVFSA